LKQAIGGNNSREMAGELNTEALRVWEQAAEEAIWRGTRAVRAMLSELNEKIERIKEHMSALDDKIAALTTEVANNTTVEKSALALINGFAAQLQTAVQAALAAGATDAQLKALTDLQSSLSANDTELSAAVAANTPPPAPPQGGTPSTNA
jgi:uncharacterized coiled-coil protein SlyX